MAGPDEKGQSVETEETSTEETSQQQETQEVEPSTEEQQTEEVVETNEEPGGTDPTAVYARKQRQERNRLAKQLSAEREARIRMEERLKVLETTKAQPQEEKIWTPVEVRKAVEQGLISQDEATVFLADQTARTTYKKLETERQQKETSERPLRQAETEITQYLAFAPYLTDDGDSRTQRVVDAYNQIRYKYNLPDNLVTKAMAIREVLGPVERLQKQKRVDTLTRDGTVLHAARSGGSSVGSGQGDEALLGNAPAHLREMWDKFRTPTKDRITELKIYHKKHPPKK